MPLNPEQNAGSTLSPDVPGTQEKPSLQGVEEQSLASPQKGFLGRAADFILGTREQTYEELGQLPPQESDPTPVELPRTDSPEASQNRSQLQAVEIQTQSRRGGEPPSGGRGTDTGPEDEKNPDAIPKWWPQELGKKEWDKWEESPGERPVKALVYYDQLPWEERAKPEIISYFLEAKGVLEQYAGEDKLYDTNELIAEQKNKLMDFDRREIERVGQVSPELGEVLQIRIDDLDRTEYELSEMEKMEVGNEDKRPIYYSKEEWEKLAKKKQEIKTKQEEIKKELGIRAGGSFLEAREALQKEIKDQVENIEGKNKKEENQQEEEQDIAFLLKIQRDNLEYPPPEKPYDEAAYTVQETLDFIKNEKGKPVRERNIAELEKAEKTLDWFLYNAAENGVFSDLERGLSGDYAEFAEKVIASGGVSKRFVPREVKTKMQAFADEYAQVVERELDWDLVSDNLPSGAQMDLNRYKGIRGEFIRRSYLQMNRALANLAEGKIKHLPIRLWGWNYHDIERPLIDHHDRNERATTTQLQFEEDDYRVILLGKNRGGIEIGVEQFATVLLSGSSYDVDKIFRRMNNMVSAIDRSIAVIESSEGITYDKAKAILDNLRRTTENRVYFYLAQHFANIIQTENYCAVLEKWANDDGLDRLKALPTQMDGMVGLALDMLRQPEYRMWFRPEGFRGQLLRDQNSQRYLRKKIRNQLERDLMGWELALPEDATSKEREELLNKLIKASSRDEFRKNFRVREKDLGTAVKKAREFYRTLREELEVAQKQGKKGLEILELVDKVKEAREIYLNVGKANYELTRRVKAAVDFAFQAFDALGESGKLGAPSIIMAHDHIRVDDVRYFGKYAIIDHIRRNRQAYVDSYARQGLRYGVDIEEGEALIRWRAREWSKNRKIIDGKPATDQAGNPIIVAKVENADKKEVPVEFTLVKDFEDTGLTLDQWNALQSAFRNLREYGFLAKIHDKKLEEIIQLNEVRPVLNTFLSADLYSDDMLNSRFIAAESAKGRQQWFAKIKERLGLHGRNRIEVVTPQQQMDTYMDLIENSRSFDSTMWKLTYYEGTRDLNTGKFTADRIMMGYPGLPLAVKRMQYLNIYWLTNLRNKVGRAQELLPFVPIRWSSISEEFAADHLMETIWVMKKEAYDIFYMMQFAHRAKDANAWRSFTETSISDKFEDDWKFWDKPTSDAVGNMWKVFSEFINIKSTLIDKLAMAGTEVLTAPQKEEVLNGIKAMIGRFIPLATIIEKQLSHDKSVPGSGAGIEESDKLALRYMRWLFSTQAGERRMEGGIIANKQAELILRFIQMPGSYAPGVSLWGEAWRKWKPNRNPGLSTNVPRPLLTKAA